MSLSGKFMFSTNVIIYALFAALFVLLGFIYDFSAWSVTGALLSLSLTIRLCIKLKTYTYLYHTYTEIYQRYVPPKPLYGPIDTMFLPNALYDWPLSRDLLFTNKLNLDAKMNALILVERIVFALMLLSFTLFVITINAHLKQGA